MPTKVLLIEDNQKMANAIVRGLNDKGFEADLADNGEDGETRARTSQYDAIVLDIMLPDRDGLSICQSLRKTGNVTPILLLTALGTTEDKVKGLDSGADDYLTKPFEFEELLARVRAMTRRLQPSVVRTVRYGDLELDLYSREVIHGDRRERLSNKEFALLEYLIKHPEQQLSRSEMYEKVWDMPFEPETNVIDVYIKTLRVKLERAKLPPLIHTIRGLGYYFGNTNHNHETVG